MTYSEREKAKLEYLVQKALQMRNHDAGVTEVKRKDMRDPVMEGMREDFSYRDAAASNYTCNTKHKKVSERV